MDCAVCDGELVPGAGFCGHCGARIEHEPDPTPAGPRRRRVLVAIAAVVALLVGVALAWPDSGGDDEVAAGGATTTTTRDRDGTGATGEGEAAGASPDSTDVPILDDAAAAGATIPPDAQTPGSATSSPAGLPTGSSGGAAPPPPPAPPPTAPPPTAPPGPAALVVVSDCQPSCTIPRGGRVELRVINFGGLPGGFTVDVSDGIDARPGQGTVAGGETRVVELVEVAGKRRGYRVDVLDENGALIFRTSISVGG